MIKELASNYFGGNIRHLFLSINEDLSKVSEIRIRINKPVVINIMGEEYFVLKDGTMNLSNNISKALSDLYLASFSDVKKTMELLSDYSLYAFEEEIKNGYITITGGHRIGICGQASIDNGKIKTIKNINGFNIRIRHEIKGCGEKIIEYAVFPHLKHTLIISPPGCGKTTMLRDLIRLLSDGSNINKGYNIGIADERSEIAGCYMGVPQNDVGIRTDVLDACPKALGMKILLRSMSPDIIAADEIGSIEDVEAIDEIINSGVKLICTAHGKSIEDVKNKPALCDVINRNVFELYVVLKNDKAPGEIKGIYDKNFKEMSL